MYGTLPNPAQLRAMARPAPAPRPCMPGRHCERRARELGACIAGECNPPAPASSTLGVGGTDVDR